MDRKLQHHGSEGQAMAEFLVGLVCIMLLIVGIQQISFLSQKGFKAMTAARHAMAWQYAENPPSEWPIFNFGVPTRPGMDSKNLTADDRRGGGDDSFYQDMDGYLDMVYDDEIERYLLGAVGRTSPHIDLKYSEGTYTTTTALDMMYAAGHEAVFVVPFMDEVLGRDRILIGRDLWMPRWDAIP